MRQQRQSRGSLALLVCLLALAHGVRAQGGLLDMFTNPTATPTPTTTDGTTPTTTDGTNPTPTPTTTDGTNPTPTTTTTDGTNPTPTPTTDGTTPTPTTTDGTTPTPTPTTDGTTPTPTTTDGTNPTPTPTTDSTTPTPTTTTTDGTTPTPTTDGTVPTTPATTPSAPLTEGIVTGTPTTPTTTNGTVPAASSPPASTTPVATPSSAPPASTPPVVTTPTGPVQLNANATAGTPPVDAPVGSDAAAVTTVGTVGTVDQLAAEATLPPGPPMDWTTLQKDCQLVFDVEIRGAYIAPWTSPKATVIARVLRDRYLRSATLPDISVQSLGTFSYLSYDKPDANDALAAAQDAAADASGATGSAAGGRRRLAGARLLLQVSKSGAELKIVVATSSVRTDSEINTFVEGVESGMMARDFTLAGVDTENLTMLQPPYQEDLVGPGTVDQAASSGGTQSWVIGVIVGVILLLLPVPLFLLVRWRKRKNREARDRAAAEAEAARERMHSKMMLRTGSKSFSLRPGAGGGSADIMVRSGSMGGLAGYANNGRLQSWSGSPDRQYGQMQYNNPYAISRATSAASLGSALPSARGASYTRSPSLPGGNMPRGPAGMPPPPAGAYEEELQTARSTRSQNGGA